MLSLRLGHAGLLLLLAAASTSVLGAPLNEVNEAHSSLVSRQSRFADDPFNEAEICGHELEKESKDDIWYKTGAGLLLDTVINSKTKSGGYDNWVQKLDKYVWDKKQSDAWDCTSFPGKCGTPADCHEFHRLQQRGTEYWIFKAISGAHKFMNRWYTAFENQTIATNFELDTIISDFSGNVKDLTDIYAKMAGAFTIAGGTAGALPGPGALVGGGLTSIAGIFALAALDAPSDPKDNATEYLMQYFTQSRGALENLARNLFGTGDMNEIPHVETATNWQTPVARYFDGGKFLIENVDVATRYTLELAQSRLRQAIGISVLESHDWKVFIDTATNEGACVDAGRSRIWKGDRSECWGVLKWDTIPSGDPFSKSTIKITHLQDEVVGTMHKYGMDLDAVYNNAVACKLARPDGSPRAIKVKHLKTDSTELPECFFSIDVLKGEFINSDTEYVPADLWGKW